MVQRIWYIIGHTTTDPIGDKKLLMRGYFDASLGKDEVTRQAQCTLKYGLITDVVPGSTESWWMRYAGFVDDNWRFLVGLLIFAVGITVTLTLTIWVGIVVMAVGVWWLVVTHPTDV